MLPYRYSISCDPTADVHLSVAITGSTGGLGKIIAEYFAAIGARLILIDRNGEKSRALASGLCRKYNVEVACVQADMSDVASVAAAAKELSHMNVDILILNAGAYAIKKEKCSTGVDRVFQINALSVYFFVSKLLPSLKAQDSRVVLVSSLAMKYTRFDSKDPDFSKRSAKTAAYANSKRFITFSLDELLSRENVEFSAAHPGITPTGITSNYPAWLQRLIKTPMKLIFMAPEKAALSIISASLEKVDRTKWTSPRFFEIWGKPKKCKLPKAKKEEREKIFASAQELLASLDDENTVK